MFYGVSANYFVRVFHIKPVAGLWLINSSIEKS